LTGSNGYPLFGGKPPHELQPRNGLWWKHDRRRMTKVGAVVKITGAVLAQSIRTLDANMIGVELLSTRNAVCGDTVIDHPIFDKKHVHLFTPK